MRSSPRDAQPHRDEQCDQQSPRRVLTQVPIISIRRTAKANDVNQAMERPMNTNPESDNDVPVRETGSGSAALSRLMWMLFGPMLLCVITYGIVTSGSGWLTTRDVAYVVVVALMVGGRRWEHRSGAALTATGEPATKEHLTRYVRILLPLAAGIWVLANVLGNHVLVLRSTLVDTATS